MSESENKSGRNFAPMPLAVLASDASRSAKLLILALFHHDWDGEKAWPSQDRLAIIMSCSRDTVTEPHEGMRWVEDGSPPPGASAIPACIASASLG